jgi:hypothetical protein
MHLTFNSPPEADYRPPQNAHPPEWAAGCAFSSAAALRLSVICYF